MDRDAIRSASLKIIGVVEGLPRVGDKGTRRDWLAPPDLSTFQRLEPLGFGVGDDDRWWFDPLDCTPDLVWPLDVSTIADQNGVGEMSMQRFRSVEMKQVRGYATRFSPYMVRADIGQTGRGKLLTAAGLMAWLGGRWVEASPSRNGNFSLGDGLNASMAVSIAFRQRYEWAVALGLDGSPSVRFSTDPTGMKEAFRVRDLPEGRDRRDALINWVGDHWRQNRADPDVEVYVRKHLRGSESFSWKGMSAEIIPARFDLDQREKLIEERKAMKAAGTDRRAKAA
jgi:hypothetical protein